MKDIFKENADWTLATVALIILCVCLLAVEALNSPTVYVAGHKCVGVTSTEEVYTCANLPSRYTITHVSPQFKLGEL